MCRSFANEGKTQVGWATTVGWRTSSVNNTPSKGSPYHALDSNEMIVRSPCLKAFEKIMEMGMHKIDKQMGKANPRCQ